MLSWSYNCKWKKYFKLLKTVLKSCQQFQWTSRVLTLTLSLSLSVSLSLTCWWCLVKPPMLLMKTECYSNTPDPLQHVQHSEGPRYGAKVSVICERSRIIAGREPEQQCQAYVGVECTDQTAINRELNLCKSAQMLHNN